jgi:ketosteroid isomerase-like protein
VDVTTTGALTLRFTKSTALAPAIAALATAACATTPAARSIQRGPAADSAAIRHAIERGARGFMNANPDSILSHYSRDIVLSYPGIPDQDYATLEKAYRELPQRPKDIVATTTPTFDEILVDDNLAIVRVRWTTTITTPVRDTVPARTNTRYLRDLQVWRKNEAGEWRFIRGMHYRDSTAAPRS